MLIFFLKGETSASALLKLQMRCCELKEKVMKEAYGQTKPFLMEY